MKRNYQRLEPSALPSVPAKMFFACWMLFLVTPSVSFSQELVSKNPVLSQEYAGQDTDSNKADGKKANAASILLKVKLVSFTAKELDKDKVLLNWNTAREQNFSHFTIEKSLDGTEFSDAGIIFSMDDSEQSRTYSFTDKLKAGVAGTIYYRLKMVDIDGKSQFSPIKMVKVGKEKAKVATAASQRNI